MQIANGRAFAHSIADRAASGERLSGEEILALFDLPLPELAAAANRVRLGRTDPETATYSIGGNIDYTNICVVACGFCAFYRAKHQPGAFTLPFDEIGARMEEIRRIGGLDVLIEGGVNPSLAFDWYVDLMRFLKDNYAEVHVDALSPEEVLGLEKLTGRDASELLTELKEAGLDGMPGAAAEILVDEVRLQAAPARIRSKDWMRIIDAAQRLGLHIPWVGMVTGLGETPAQRVEHLLALRAQQDHALADYGNGFAAFKVWPMRLDQTRLRDGASNADPQAIAREYLRHVAIARLALDNIANHRAVWRTMGFGIASEALRSGANDLCGTGSINAIDAAMAAAGKCVPDPNGSLLDQVRGCIREAGFIPALRDPYYRVLMRHVPNGERRPVSSER